MCSNGCWHLLPGVERERVADQAWFSQWPRENSYHHRQIDLEERCLLALINHHFRKIIAVFSSSLPPSLPVSFLSTAKFSTVIQHKIITIVVCRFTRLQIRECLRLANFLGYDFATNGISNGAHLRKLRARSDMHPHKTSSFLLPPKDSVMSPWTSWILHHSKERISIGGGENLGSPSFLLSLLLTHSLMITQQTAFGSSQTLFASLLLMFPSCLAPCTSYCSRHQHIWPVISQVSACCDYKILKQLLQNFASFWRGKSSDPCGNWQKQKNNLKKLEGCCMHEGQVCLLHV